MRSTSPFDNPQQEDLALDLHRAGAEPAQIAATVWGNRAPIDLSSLIAYLRELDLQTAGQAPSDELPTAVEQAKQDMEAGLKLCMAELRVDPANGFLHKAAQGYTTTLLKIETFRMGKQVHNQQLRHLQAQERAAAAGRYADPFPGLPSQGGNRGLPS